MSKVPFQTAVPLVLPPEDVITIRRNNSDGRVDFKMSRDMPFPEVAMILSKLAANICEQGLVQLAAHFSGKGSGNSPKNLPEFSPDQKRI